MVRLRCQETKSRHEKNEKIGKYQHTQKMKTCEKSRREKNENRKKNQKQQQEKNNKNNKKHNNKKEQVRRLKGSATFRVQGFGVFDLSCCTISRNISWKKSILGAVSEGEVPL